MSEEIIPVVLFIATAIVVCVMFWFRFRSRSEMQQTIRIALDKGHELTPEIVERLGRPAPSEFRDLRFGVIWIAVAVGLASFGAAVPEPDVPRIFLGISALPASIGIGFLLLYKFTRKP